MKTLYLLRHAHAVSAATPLVSDRERILSPQGTEEALAVAQFMQLHDMCPDFVLSSSSVRTIQTARLIFSILFNKVGLRVSSHFDQKLYQAPAEKILAEIQATDPSIRHLMMIGHNPGVAELALALGKSAAARQLENYAPATLTVFTADCGSWADFSPASTKLETVFVPGEAAG